MASFSTYKVNSQKTHSVTILPVPTNCTWQWANFTAFLLTYWFSIWTLMGVFTSSYSYCNISSKSVFIFMLCCILTLNTQNFSATGESSKKIYAFDMNSPVSLGVYYSQKCFILFVACCAADGRYIISQLFRECMKTCAQVKKSYCGNHLVCLLMEFPVTDKAFQTGKLVFSFQWSFLGIVRYLLNCHLFPFESQG